MRAIASLRWCAFSFGGLTNLTPRARARLRPSPVRARINSRSNSAPGTELAFEREIESDSLWLTRRLESQVARFRRVNEERTFGHHDALELPSGKVVLLTRLLVGPRATVLQLPVAEREKQTERSEFVTAQPSIP